jgi:uncharacterized membrane protein
MRPKYDKEFLDLMSRNQANWRGVFYFNPKDPRLLVPKINPSLGWTLNFASPYSYLALLGVLGISIACGYFL